MKKGILSTILVIQLILLVLLTFSSLQAKRETFTIQNQYQRMAAYRTAASFVDIAHDYEYLKDKNATADSLKDYISFVNNTFKEKFLLDIYFNGTHLVIEDKHLEMRKEGDI